MSSAAELGPSKSFRALRPAASAPEGRLLAQRAGKVSGLKGRGFSSG